MNFFKFLKKHLLISIFTIVIIAIPLILMLVFISNPFDFVHGSNDAWIGFWGSYIGGIVSVIAAAVIAFFVSDQERKIQREENKKQRDELNKQTQELEKKRQQEEKIKMLASIKANIITERYKVFINQLSTLLTKIDDLQKTANIISEIADSPDTVTPEEADRLHNLGLLNGDLRIKNYQKKEIADLLKYIEANIIPSFNTKDVNYVDLVICPLRDITKNFLDDISDVGWKSQSEYLRNYVEQTTGDESASIQSGKKVRDNLFHTINRLRDNSSTYDKWKLNFWETLDCNIEKSMKNIFKI